MSKRKKLRGRSAAFRDITTPLHRVMDAMSPHDTIANEVSQDALVKFALAAEPAIPVPNPVRCWSCGRAARLRNNRYRCQKSRGGCGNTWTPEPGYDLPAAYERTKPGVFHHHPIDEPSQWLFVIPCSLTADRHIIHGVWSRPTGFVPLDKIHDHPRFNPDTLFTCLR